MLDYINVVVGELGALVVEAVFIGDHVLEWGCVNLVCNRLAVDWVLDCGILDLEGPVGVEVEIVPSGLLDHSLGDTVANAKGIELAAWHRVCLIVNDAVVDAAIEEGIHSQREDVLMVNGQHTWMDTSTEWNIDAVIDWLGAQDTWVACMINLARSLFNDPNIRAHESWRAVMNRAFGMLRHLATVGLGKSDVKRSSKFTGILTFEAPSSPAANGEAGED